ncbi:MAG TPA: elongation factor P [Dehalococcoidales bacterium]|nr:elongation factor P [Dehalococcoidales bacterium]
MNIEEVTRNTKILIDNTPMAVETVEFVKPGKGRAIYKFRLRNLFSGNVLDITYHSGDKVEETTVTVHEMQYLYKEGDNYIFMDNSSFEQMPMTEAQTGVKAGYLKEGTPVVVMMWEDRPIDLQLPKIVELKVVEASASLKGATITAQMKEGKLETGITIGVPAFIKDGDIIKVDTRTGTYIERVGSK